MHTVRYLTILKNNKSKQHMTLAIMRDKYLKYGFLLTFRNDYFKCIIYILLNDMARYQIDENSFDYL